MVGIIERLRAWRRWRQTQAELAEEMESHRALKRAELERAGVEPGKIAAATQRAMGNDTWMREEARGVWLWPWIEALGQGLRQGGRRLWRAPGFTLVAVITLGLGIGANTAIFSVVEAVLLRPLPYPQPDRIAALSLHRKDGEEPALSLPEFEYYRDHARETQSASAYAGMGTTEVRYRGGTAWADGVGVTNGFFSALGASPWLGRGITAGDTRPGAPGSVVLSERMWRQNFRADGDVLGQNLEIGDQVYTIVGVMPRGFRFQEQPADFFVSLRLGPGIGVGYNYKVIARLRPGANLISANAEARGLAGGMRSRELLPSWSDGLRLDNYQALLTSPVEVSLWLLLGAVGLLLLIACVNVASLVMARALARQPETALRRALGASQGRLFIQYLSEAMVLAGMGAACGWVLAELGVRGLASKLPWDVPLAAPVALDLRVLGFTLALAMGASLAFSVATLGHGLRTSLAPGRFVPRGRAREVLVAAEVALAFLLLAGAGLLIKSLQRLQQQPLGFDPAGVTLFHTLLPDSLHPTTVSGVRYDQALLERLRALPGVTGAAAITMPPLEGQNNLPAKPEGGSLAATTPGGSVEYRAVTSGYFSTMRIPLLAGRELQASDMAGAPSVVVVSAALAQRWFPPGQALGERIRVGAFGDKTYPDILEPERVVVGVVGDVKVQNLQQPTRLMAYVPTAQVPESLSNNVTDTWWVVRGGGAGIAARLHDIAVQANPAVRVDGEQPYAAAVDLVLAPPRFEARLMGLFALLALILTAVGLYGSLAYAVTQRTREIGIRMALGARRSDVMHQVVGRGLGWAAVGMVGGVVAALPLAHLLASLLFGVRPLDAPTLAGVLLLLTLVALAACYLPARRATRIDPVRALRNE